MKRSATLLTLTATAVVITSCASAGPPEAPTTTAPSASAVAREAPASPAPAPASGVFTEVQASRGKGTFRTTCSDCHYSSEFRGSEFQFKWRRRTVGDLFKNISENMPDDAPGSLSQQEYLDVVTYILQLNGFPAGTAELVVDGEAMSAVSLEAPSDSGAVPVPLFPEIR